MRAAYVHEAEKIARSEPGAISSALLAKLAADAATAERDERKQAQRDTWSEWRPAHAPHVIGRWNGRTFDDDGLPEEQRVVIKCEHCGAEYQRGCTSGLVQQHVQRFAVVHLHRDVLHVRPKVIE